MSKHHGCSRNQVKKALGVGGLRTSSGRPVKAASQQQLREYGKRKV